MIRNFAVKTSAGFFLCLALWCIGIGLSGCGYAFQGSGSILPADVKNVYIPRVENNSTESSLTSTLTEALRDRFERFGVVTVVEDINEADAVLKSRIIKISKSTRTVTSNTDATQQYDTTMTVGAELRRTTGAVLWRNPHFTVTKDFGTSSDIVVSSSADFAGGSLGASDLGGLDTREIARGQEQEALNDLAEQVAKKIYDEAVAPDF